MLVNVMKMKKKFLLEGVLPNYIVFITFYNYILSNLCIIFQGILGVMQSGY
jgi:hypothetical protein